MFSRFTALGSKKSNSAFEFAKAQRMRFRSAERFERLGAKGLHPAELLVAAIELADIGLAAAKKSKLDWPTISRLFKSSFEALEATSPEVFWSWSQVRGRLPEVALGNRIEQLQGHAPELDVERLRSRYDSLLCRKAEEELQLAKIRGRSA